MCGIIGIFGSGLSGTDPLDSGVLRHRGPDGQAGYRSPDSCCFLGATRLALVRPDLPARIARAGPLVSCAAGELYNYRQLADELGVEPEIDTDLIPLLWRRWGPGLLRRIRGPLSAAVFDEQTRELVLLRDAVGKRPLFWARVPGGVVFASEMKAFPTALRGEPRPEYLERALLFGHAPEGVTPFTAVNALRPGECLRVREGQVSVTQEDCLRATAPSNIDDVLQALLESVRLRGETEQRSAVALGGMDSLVVAQLLGFPPGFTVDRDPGEMEQLRLALGTVRQQEPTLVAPAMPSPSATRRCLWHLETVDSGASWQMAASTLALARRVARSGSRILFTGEGADELFLGYPWQLRALAGLPDPKASIADGRVASLTDEWRPWLSSATAWERMRFFSPAIALFLRPEIHRLLGRPVAPPEPQPGAGASAEGLARALQLQSLREDMHRLPVPHNDRLFFAAGVETRMPFLDRRVVDAALGLPPEALVSPRGAEKPVVRALFLRAYGREAPAKLGFSGAQTPPAAVLRAWVESRTGAGGQVVAADVLRELAASDSWIARELAWRGLLLEELYDVMRETEPPALPEGS